MSNPGPASNATNNVQNLQVPAGITTASLNTVMNAANGAYDIRNYGALSDGKQLRDVRSTNSNICIINSATANFTIADIGKLCVVIKADATGSQNARGFISAYNSPTSITASLNVSPTALSGAEFIYGTDDTAAINACTLAASNNNQAVFIPCGITIFSSALSIPAGVSNIFGVGNKPFAGLPENANHKWYGSTLCLIGNVSDGITFGTGSGNAASDGMGVRDLNIDFTNKASRGCVGSSWTIIFDRCTIARAYTSTIELTGSMVLRGSTVFNQQQGTPVKLNPADVRVIDNYIYGAATTLPLLIAAGHDQVIMGNHFFRDPDATGAIGTSVQISQTWGANINRGSTIVTNNVFDTQKGACVEIVVNNTSVLQAVCISNNVAFQNDIANDTYFYITITVAAGSAIRALTITGNTGQGSFINASTLGVWKAFIDGSGIAGNVYGATVVGNAIDNCNLLYSSFTPSYTAGNVTIAGYGTVVSVG